MITNSLCDRLVETMENQPFCASILRDWQWFLGEPIVPGHFQARTISHYLRCLAEVLAEHEIIEVQTTLNRIWQRGYELGVLGKPASLAKSGVMKDGERTLAALNVLEGSRPFVDTGSFRFQRSPHQATSARLGYPLSINFGAERN